MTNATDAQNAGRVQGEEPHSAKQAYRLRGTTKSGGPHIKRFAMFVDGSNLDGLLNALRLRINYYDKFFKYMIDTAANAWKKAVIGGSCPPLVLQRAYWYRIGTMDEWNVSDPAVIEYVRSMFDRAEDLKRERIARAKEKLGSVQEDDIYKEAWATCWHEIKEWYNEKLIHIRKQKQFYSHVRSQSSFLDIVACGNWKLDLLNRRVTEKGLDTKMAVDMVAKVNMYDICLVLCRDEDIIPAITEVRARGCHVGTVECVGAAPEKRKVSPSEKLRGISDFVIEMREDELLEKNIAIKYERPASNSDPT